MAKRKAEVPLIASQTEWLGNESVENVLGNVIIQLHDKTRLESYLVRRAPLRSCALRSAVALEMAEKSQRLNAENREYDTGAPFDDTLVSVPTKKPTVYKRVFFKSCNCCETALGVRSLSDETDMPSLQEENIPVQQETNSLPSLRFFGGNRLEYERGQIFASQKRRSIRKKQRTIEGKSVAQRSCPAEAPGIPFDLVGALLEINKCLSTCVKSGNKSQIKKVASRFQQLVFKDCLLFLCDEAFSRCLLFYKLSMSHALHSTFSLRESVGKAVAKILIQKLTNQTSGFRIDDIQAPVCRSSIRGVTPTLQAPSLVFEACRVSAKAVLRLLLEAGGSPNDIVGVGTSSLMIATVKNDIEVMSILTDFNVNTAYRTSSGLSALLVAVYRGNYEAAEFLVQKGVDLNICQVDGSTPLILALEEGHQNIVKLLLEAGADVNQCKENGSSPIIVAVRHSRPEMIPLLGEYNANPDQQLSNGASAIVLACANGDLESVRHLLDLGANVFCPLHTGATALQYAVHRGHNQIVMRILQSLETKLTDQNLDRLAGIAEKRGHKQLTSWLALYKRETLSDLHYHVCFGDVAESITLLKALPHRLHGSLLEQLLLLAHPHVYPCIERAAGPFSIANAEFWPERFLKSAQLILGPGTAKSLPTELRQDILSFCGPDWF